MRYSPFLLVLVSGILGFSLVSNGIITGENEDCGQSYAWSMEEYGDYIYIGTCYNPIYGLFYHAFTGALQDTFQEDTTEVVTSLIRIIYGENIYENQNTNPAIIKVNKKTGESSLLFRYKEEKTLQIKKGLQCLRILK